MQETNLTMPWSERRSAVCSTFEMTSTLPLIHSRDSPVRSIPCSARFRPASLILFALGL